MASGVAGHNEVVQQLVFENSEMTGARDRDEVEVGEREAAGRGWSNWQLRWKTSITK